MHVPPQGRRDIDGGHGDIGPGVVGLVEIVPDDPKAAYIAQIFQYGQNAPLGVVPPSFSFALGETFREGAGNKQYLGIHRGADSSWIGKDITPCHCSTYHKCAAILAQYLVKKDFG